MNREISMKIKFLRKVKGYTQRELASLLNVGQTTVANYESGLRIPDTEKLARIAGLFEVTVDYLLGREDNILSKRENKINTGDLKATDEASSVFFDLLLEGKKEEARELISSLHEEGANIRDLYFEVLGRALKEVGVLWERGSIDVWKEHYISEVVMDIMRGLKAGNRKSWSKPHSVMALTPGPELHSIGLKMIADLLELEGWEVTYLGSNVPVQSIISAVETKRPDLIALSVTMPYHIEAARNTISALKSCFGSKTPSIIVGGGAFSNSKDPWGETGADYYGVSLEDVVSTVEKGGI